MEKDLEQFLSENMTCEAVYSGRNKKSSIKKSIRKMCIVPVLKARAKRIGPLIINSTQNCSSILDLGCGDMILTDFLNIKSDKKVVGIDTLDSNLSDLPLLLYDGTKLPFEDKSFDASLVAFVLHHCQNISGILEELKRVTKKKIIILEEVYRNILSQKLLHLHDFGNILLSSKMDIPLNFLTLEAWKETFGKLDLIISNCFRIYQYPVFNLTQQVFFELNIESS